MKNTLFLMVLMPTATFGSSFKKLTYEQAAKQFEEEIERIKQFSPADRGIEAYKAAVFWAQLVKKHEQEVAAALEQKKGFVSSPK